MRIAVGYDEGKVHGHLGSTKQFKLYLVENDKVVKTQIVGTDGARHGQIAYFLHDLAVDTVITGGMGYNMKQKFDTMQMDYYSDVSGDADEAVEDLLLDKLNYDNSKIIHHHHLPDL